MVPLKTGKRTPYMSQKTAMGDRPPEKDGVGQYLKFHFSCARLKNVLFLLAANDACFRKRVMFHIDFAGFSYSVLTMIMRPRVPLVSF